jgi:hypothetical protein
VASIFAIVFLAGFFILLGEFLRMAREGIKRRKQPSAPMHPPVMAGGSVEADVALQKSAPTPMVRTNFGLGAVVVLAVMGMFVFFPPVSDASEASTKFHHLAHAMEFFVGIMLGVALGSSPAYLKRVAPRWSNVGLVVVLVVPVAMLLLMVPAVYTELSASSFQHGAYHLLVAFLGLLTGLGAVLMGRVAGWAILITGVGMALMYAAGVGG